MDASTIVKQMVLTPYNLPSNFFRFLEWSTIFGPGHLALCRAVSSHCLEVHMDEGRFPIGSLDEVSLFWRLKDSDGMDTARLW